MKTKYLLISAFSAAGLLSAGAASSADSHQGQAEVVYHEPESFTDVGADSQGTEQGKAGNLRMLREHIQKEAARLLPAGHRLVVTITDIDLAGQFEPWRSAELQDVRIVKEISPPRIELSYHVIDARGDIVSEGQRELSDLTFLSTLPLNRQEPLRHEKELLTDWMRRDLQNG